jgi:hypothetical protein
LISNHSVFNNRHEKEARKDAKKVAYYKKEQPDDHESVEVRQLEAKFFQFQLFYPKEKEEMLYEFDPHQNVYYSFDELSNKVNK